jgi:small subunit ribosomal protein S1
VAEEDLEKRMAEMVGRTIPLKVIEVNRSRNRLILSERAATQEMRVQRKEQLLDELREGEIRHGRVTSICDFGAFVDLGGADGLVHLSELSWSQIGHPSEVVKVGDEVDVQILGVDRDKKKIALSLRRSQPGPWTRVADRYKVGDIVTGKITKLTNFGAFARIEDGVEGLIHVSELADARVPHPRNVVKEGDTLTLRVIRIDAERRRLGLSLKQAQEEHAELTSEVSSDDVSSDTSNVDSDDSTAPAAAEQPEQSPEQTVEAELASASVESAAE